MKRIACLFSALMICVSVFAQGIAFQKESYAEVLKMAKKQKKLVFVDIYTSWCGPCRHMAKNIFPQVAAGDFFNAHFLNLQLDAEKSEDGRMVAQKFGVSAYPTFLFVDGDGELVYRFLGGRVIDQFIQEGKRALAAYEARPKLEKYRKKYERGKNDRKFLDEYIALNEQAGLDCSEVLLAYFAQVEDRELLDSLQLARIQKVSIYNKGLAERMIGAIEQEVKIMGKENRTVMTKGKAVAIYLGACLKDVSQSDDESIFEEVLALKARLFSVTGIKDSATSASLGGGNIYVPSDLSRLDYYFSHRKVDRFVQVLTKYIADLQVAYEKSYAAKQAMKAEMDKKLADANKSGNTEEYNMIKKMKAMMFAFSGIDDYYISTRLLQHLENYESIFSGEKNETYKQQVADWYVFVYRLSCSAKTAVFVADKLIVLDRKEMAMEVLSLGLSEGSEAPGVEKEDIDTCREKLNSLK